MKREHDDDANEGNKRRPPNLPPMPSIPKVANTQVATTVHKYHGTSGRPVSIHSNYYRVNFKEPIKIFQYHIEFMPPVEVRRIKAGVISKLNIGEFILADPQLFVPKDLGDGIDANVTYTPKNGEETTYQVKIKPIKDYKWKLEDMYKLFNLHVKKLMRSMRLEQIGRNYYDPSKAIPVRFRDRVVFDLYPGFFTVLELMQGGIMLNVELKHKVVRTDTVYSEIKNKREEEANALFKDTVVFTTYNKKPYIVTRIDYGLTMHKTTFPDNKTGTQISVFQYMQQRYPQAMRNVRDFNQALIVCEPKKKLPTDTRPPNYLIPELCIVSGLTDRMKNDFQLMKIFKSHTLIEPEERLKRLFGLISSFSNPNIRKTARVQDWDIEVQEVPVELTARELPSESIYLRDPRTKKEKSVPTFNGEWNIPRSNGLVMSNLKNGDPIHWAVLFPHDYQPKRFFDGFREVITGLGLNFSGPLSKLVNSKDNSSYANEIKNLPEDTDLVVCILPFKVKEPYEKIKKFACRERPIPTQCVTIQVLDKDVRSVGTKLALQIVGKLGGVPWSLKFENIKKPTMIIGIDLTHNAGKSSCVGMVASMNNDVTAFYSQAYPVESGTQIITNKLGLFIKDACLEYRKINNIFPSCILVYRDGVGDSQMKRVIEIETAQITACLAQGKVAAEVIFIIAQRRVNARFFLIENRGRHGNVRSGTIIDTVVVASEKKHADLGTTCDFYLVGQSHMQGKNPAAGTMNPVHYWVKHPLINEPNATTIDTIQSITYKLCHVYYNWSGTISVPAVCKYAKVLAEMAGKFIEGPTHPALYNKLYFM